MKKSKIEKYTRAADMGDNAASKFVNYGVKKKVEGKYILKRILLILGYLLFAVVYSVIFLGPFIKIPGVIAFLPLFIWILIFFTWRFVSIEYEYYILDGEFRMLEVYGSKSSRELCRVRVSAMKTIAPYRDANKAAADAIDSANRIEAVSSMSAPDIYYGIFAGDDGNDCVVFFEVAEKTLKVLKYYNSEIEIVKTTH